MAALGEWYIELRTQGQDTVLDNVRRIQDLLLRADKRQRKSLDDQQKSVKTLGVAYQQFGRQLSAGTVMATAALIGFARAGYQGSVQGQALAVRFQMLSREIAATLLPYTDLLTDKMGDLIEWFRRLDGDGQKLVGMWITLGAAMRMALTGHPILALATAMAAFLMNTKEGRDLFKELETTAKELLRVLGPMMQDALRAFGQHVKDIATEFREVLGLVNQIASALPSGGGGSGGSGGSGALVRAILAPSRLAVAFNPVGIGSDLVRGRDPRRRFAGILGGGGGGGGAGEGSPGFTNIAGIVSRAIMQGQNRRPRQEILPAGGNWEALAESFRRVQSAAIREDIPARQLQVAEAQLSILAASQGVLQGMLRFQMQNLRPQPNAVQP